MTKEEWDKFEAELEQAREEHKLDFKRWYGTANFLDIEDYAETGYMLYHYLRSSQEI